MSDEDFITKSVCPLLSFTDRAAYNTKRNADNKDPKELLLLRLLLVQCQRMMNVSLKHLEGRDTAPLPLNNADRGQRRKAYQKQLETAGELFEDALCHAHCIEDDAFSMVQRGELSYLSPLHCPTSAQESGQERLTSKSSRPDAPGIFLVGPGAAKQRLEVQGEKERPEVTVVDAMDLGNALKRRGGGFQVGGLMDDDKHEKIGSFLLRHLRKAAPRSDMVPPTVDDILDCDKAIFVELAKRCERDPMGLASIHLHIPDVLGDPEILAMVGCRYGQPSSSSSTGPAKRSNPQGGAVAKPNAKPKPTPGPNAAKNKVQRDRKNARIKAEREELEALRASSSSTGGNSIPPPPPAPAAAQEGQWRAPWKGKKGRGKGQKGAK